MDKDYDFESAFARIEDELLRSMMRNMKKHKAWEDAEGFNWSMWQAEQLKGLDKYKQLNKKKFGREFRNINARIQEAIEKSREEGGLDQEIEILKALRKGYKPPRKPRGTAKMQAAFFRLNDRKMDALIKATLSDVQKAETAILRMANDKYRKVIFDAQVYANSGAGTYEKAVDMAARDFMASGLNCVEYSNDARHTLADYADMAIRTASKRAYLTGEGEKRKEWGISTVIVNKRGNPCPRCLPFVGRIFIDDVWSGGKKSDGPYPLLSSAIAAGLYHPRCKDSHTTYFPGISTAPGRRFTTQDIRGIQDKYTAEQRKRNTQSQIKKYSRMARFSLNHENAEVCRKKAEAWKTKLAQIKGMEYNDSIEKAREYAKRELNIEYDRPSTDHLNPIVADNLNQVIKDYQDTFGEESLALKGIRVIDEEVDWYAAYSPPRQEIFLRSTASREAIQEMRNYAAKQHKAGWWSTGDENSAFRHEIGHSLHGNMELSKEQEMAITKLRTDILGKCSPIGSINYADYRKAGLTRRDWLIDVKLAGEYLSGYGLYDNDEFIAEALSEYMLFKGESRETAKAVVNILRGE